MGFGEVDNEYEGIDHDKKILDEQELTCTSKLELKADTGFIGYTCSEATITLPHKKKRKKKGESPWHKPTYSSRTVVQEERVYT